jgi:DNA-binding transcriptional LysR family regulator
MAVRPAYICASRINRIALLRHPASNQLSGTVKDILSLKLYTRVARLGSFSAAAREFGLSQSQVSRIIADLESDLGARLLTRTTRAVVLTDAGAEFLSRLDPILTALEDAGQSVREGSELRGMLRMSMPSSVAIREVIPRVAPFLARHPELRLQMLLGDRPQDLVRDAVDVAIRLGNLVDSSATARLMTHIQRVIIAAPEYIERHGAPATPDELKQHRIVGGPASVVPAGWKFSRGDEDVTVELEAHFFNQRERGRGGCGDRRDRYHFHQRMGLPPRACRWLARQAAGRMANRRHSGARILSHGPGHPRCGTRGRRIPHG